jgi:hypothetical protein
MGLRGSRHARPAGVVGVLTALLALVIAVMQPPSAAHTRISGVTWSEHVKPILDRRCAACHGEGRSARPALGDLREAVEVSRRIKQSTLLRLMPPWNATAGFGAFENDKALTAYELDVLVSWVDGGLLPGPSLPDAHLHDSGDLHPPDLVLDTGRETVIDATRRTYRFTTRLPASRAIRGWRFDPGNRALVRRARVVIEPAMLLGVWLPDEEPVFLPDGVSAQLPAGVSVRVDVDYIEPLTQAVDRSRVGLYFSGTPRRPLRQMTLRRGATTLRQDAHVTALTPSLGTAGQSVRVVATRPDQSVEPLLWVREFDSRFARTYRLQRPIRLPTGSRIDVWSFDAAASIEMNYAGSN